MLFENKKVLITGAGRGIGRQTAIEMAKEGAVILGLGRTAGPLEEMAGAEHIERVDAWKEPHRADKYHVERLPTVVLLDGETVHMNRTGAIDIDEVTEWLKGGSYHGNVDN